MLWAFCPATKGIIGLSQSAFIQWVCALGCLLLLSACGAGGAVVYAPTAPPPDLSPIVYTHPGGVFSLRVPPNWGVHVQNTTTLATAAFSAPGASAPMLQVVVMNLGERLDSEGFTTALNRYQRELRRDLTHYKEESRMAMGDGSWRLTGLYHAPGGETQQVNTFVQQTGDYFTVIEALIPADAALLTELERVVNSVQVNPENALEVAPLNVLVSATSQTLEALNLLTWTTPTGVFFVTGEVGNYGPTPLRDIPVKVILISDNGLPVAEAADTLMSEFLMPGGFAPFSLRFGQGQPALTQRYELIVGGEEWTRAEVPDMTMIAGPESLSWTDESHFNENGDLLITGELHNNGGQAVHRPRVVVTVFNADQAVIGAGFMTLAPMLGAGDSAPFQVVIPDLGGDPAQYIVTAQGVYAN